MYSECALDGLGEGSDEEYLGTSEEISSIDCSWFCSEYPSISSKVGAPEVSCCCWRRWWFILTSSESCARRAE